mgnify:FL=1
MKKLAALLISVVLLLVSGCGKQDPDADQLRAEDLPESCRGWFDIAETAGAAEENSGFPAAARAAEGAAEGGIAARLPDGTEVDVVGESEQFAEGVKLSELTDGKAKRLGSGGRVIWNGELYDACTIAAENCRLPNLRPHEGGILRLDISGDCTVDGGGEEFGCFAGFDCVVVTGSGTLTIINTSGLASGTGRLPLPALLVDGGVTLRCGSIGVAANEAGVPAFALLDGTVCAESLWLGRGELVVAGGVLSARDIFEVSGATFRGGVTLLGYAGDCANMKVVLSGGALYTADALPADAAVEAGAGTLCVKDAAQLSVKKYDKATVLDSETDGSPLAYTDYSEDWAGIVSGARWDGLAAQQAEGLWFVGKLTMDNGRCDELKPWGALWLELRGENFVQAELGGTSCVLTGGGSLTADTVNIWGWGGMHTPLCSIGADTEVYCANLRMGSNAGGAGTVVISSGKLTVDNEFWLQNGTLEVRGGEVRLCGDAAIEQGSLNITGGTVIIEKGLWIGAGDVNLSGGTLVLPNGEDSLTLESGKLHNHGGTLTTE